MTAREQQADFEDNSKGLFSKHMIQLQNSIFMDSEKNKKDKIQKKKDNLEA
jgi:hypothetical protein